MALVSKLEADSYTRIPDEIVKKAGLMLGADIIWYYDDESKQVILTERPVDFAKALRGLGKELWNDIDGNTYVQEERHAWE